MTKTAMTIGLKYGYTKIGKPTRRILTNPLLTTVVGAYMDTKSSARRIDGFIRRNKNDVQIYQRVFHPERLHFVLFHKKQHAVCRS